MDFETLKMFLSVAEHGSFTRAAIQLGMTQSTISKRIQQLETQLGNLLLYRHGRGVRLTEAGVRLEEVAKSVFLQLDGIQEELAAGTHSLHGSVTLGLPPSLGSPVYVPLARRFKQKFPNASLRIVEAFSGSLLELLEAGKMDIGVLYDARLSPTMLVNPFFRETLYLIESAATIGSNEPADLSELGNKPFVLSQASPGLRRVLEAVAARENIHIDVAFEFDSLIALKRMAEIGPERCVLPYAAVHREIIEGKLRARPFAAPGLHALLVCATPLHRSVRRLAKELQVLLTEQMKACLDEGTLSGTLLR